MYNKRKFSLGICILTWNKPKTLKNTLKSYEKFGLLDIVTEKIILCQENNQDEINIAKSFGFTIYHTEKNIGIGKGIFLLTKKLTSKYMIFLENDWELLNDKFTSEILTPINYISHGIIHAYKLRHRYNYGEPLWSMNWCKNKELTDNEIVLANNTDKLLYAYNQSYIWDTDHYNTGNNIILSQPIGDFNLYSYVNSDDVTHHVIGNNSNINIAGYLEEDIPRYTSLLFFS